MAKKNRFKETSKGDVRRLMLEVGEYIRTKDGQIGIFQNIDEHVRHYGERLEDTIYIINTEKNEYLRLTDNDIKSHSKNIIYLIEVGDYVNGNKVLEVGDVVITQTSNIEDENFHLFEEKDIATIVTHEQFKEMEYRV